MKEIILDAESYAERELKEMPSYLEAMKLCTEIEIQKCCAKMTMSVITNEEEENSNKNWEECMRMQLLPNAKTLDENHQGQWKMRRDKLNRLLEENERLRELVKLPENSRILL
jgi:hypothetical protein